MLATSRVNTQEKKKGIRVKREVPRVRLGKSLAWMDDKQWLKGPLFWQVDILFSILYVLFQCDGHFFNSQYWFQTLHAFLFAYDGWRIKPCKLHTNLNMNAHCTTLLPNLGVLYLGLPLICMFLPTLWKSGPMHSNLNSFLRSPHPMYIYR